MEIIVWGQRLNIIFLALKSKTLHSYKNILHEPLTQKKVFTLISLNNCSKIMFVYA